MVIIKIGENRCSVTREEVAGIAGDIEIGKEEALDMTKTKEAKVCLMPGAYINVYDIVDISKHNSILIYPCVTAAQRYTYNVRIIDGVMKHRLIDNVVYKLDNTSDMTGVLDVNRVKTCSNIINNVVTSYIRGRYLLSTLNGRNEIYDNLVLGINTDVPIGTTDDEWIWLEVSMSNNFERKLKLIVDGYDTVAEADKIIEELVNKQAVITQIRSGIIAAVMIKEAI